MQTCECQKTEQPALEIELLAGAVQALLPDGERRTNLRRCQRGAVATSSESMRRRPRLSDDARLVRHRFAHAGLSNPSEKVPQPVGKPCKPPNGQRPARRYADRSTKTDPPGAARRRVLAHVGGVARGVVARARRGLFADRARGAGPL